MRAEPLEQIAVADVDPYPLQAPPITRRANHLRVVMFIATATLAYIVGLIATIPASAMIDEGENLRVGGTIWNGQAVIGSTVRIDWTVSPLRTLAHLGWHADWQMTGGATSLSGTVTKQGSVYTAEDVAGQIDETLAKAMAPNLPLTCKFLADARLERLVIGGDEQEMRGTLRSSPITCTAQQQAGAPVELPAGVIDIGPATNGVSTGALATIATKSRLVEFRLTRSGALSIWPTAAATSIAPFLSGVRYDTSIE